jgi:SAM-dependent methyltransferase
MDPSRIDFAGFYREQLRAANRPERSPDYWDGRAPSMNDRAFDTPYVRQFVAHMNLDGCSTLLDVGCGPGTIGLSVSPRLAHVYGLDHSPAMLAAFTENARARGVAGATPILRSWDDDWADVPVCDLVVASRSTAVPDLEAALQRLHSKARRRVYVSYPADGHMVADDVRVAIGREVAALPDFLCVVGILHHMGLHPTLDYLPGDNRLAQCADFEQFRIKLDRLLGGMSAEEVRRLAAYFEASRDRPPESLMRWALFSWEVAERPQSFHAHSKPSRGTITG